MNGYTIIKAALLLGSLPRAYAAQLKAFSRYIIQVILESICSYRKIQLILESEYTMTDLLNVKSNEWVPYH